MKRILACTIGLILSACALTPPPTEPEPLPEPYRQDALADVMFHLLRGEIAGRQGNLEQALADYSDAMLLRDDPRLAERAARIAIYLDRRRRAEQAAERWLELAPQAADAHEILGLVALRRGEITEAVEHFEAVIAATPSDEEASLEQLARSLAREDAELALRVLEALAERYPEQPQAYYRLAEQALRAEAPELALAAADKALALAADWTAPVLVKVRAQLALGEGDAALALLEQTLDEQPHDRELRLQYARTLLDLERTANALEQFQILVEDHPDDPQALYAAALLALELDQLERAREYLLGLVNMGVRLDDAYYYLGRLAEREGDTKGALRWYRQVQEVNRPQAELRIAVLLAQSGELEAAREQLAELRENVPDQRLRSYLIEGEILRRAQRLDDALEVYSEALRLWPNQLDLLYARALTAAQLGRVDRAETDLRVVLAEQPDHPLALNALGYTLVDITERKAEGFELIQRAYALKPNDPAVIDSMGWGYYQLGDYAQALEYLEQAYTLDPGGEIAAHLVETLWRLGERERARELLERALEQHPGDKALRESRKRVLP